MLQPTSGIELGRAPTVHCALDAVARVPVKRPLPCVVILIHGVNDVGVGYQAQEAGLCAGLNTRLNRSASDEKPGGDLRPADYRTNYAKALADARANDPRLAARMRADPDAVMFRRAGSAAQDGVYSPVIPFYWGYRAEDAKIDREAWHGQWLDEYGNRLDKSGAFGGGPFVNATTDLPDFWAGGFGERIAGVLDRLKGDPIRPLRGTRDRLYMVLAALRLATLVDLIRAHPYTRDAAINIMGHSQGTMITLLAQAILAERGSRAAECLVLQHSPYGFHEPFFEAVAAGFASQQTTIARVETFRSIVGFVHDSAKGCPMPSLEVLREYECGKGVVGTHWRPGKGARKVQSDGQDVEFEERDNRGKVYVYFCPEDHTVSLRNVRGIGSSGVPDKIDARVRERSFDERVKTGDVDDPRERYVEERLTLLPELARRGLRQRVFEGPHDGRPAEQVGARTGFRYTIPPGRPNSKLYWATNTHPAGESRLINGESLVPPCTPVFPAPKMRVDVIEASTALTSRKGKRFRQPETVVEDDSRPAERHGKPLSDDEYAMLVERFQQRYDQQAAAEGGEFARDYRPTVTRVRVNGTGKLAVERLEAPVVTRDRIERDNVIDNPTPYHSMIPNEPSHHEHVTAYDLAIGAPIPIEAEYEGWLDYLRSVADWRTDWRQLAAEAESPQTSDGVDAKQKLLQHQNAPHPPGAKKLIAATREYYRFGILPNEVRELHSLRLLTSQTTSQRAAGLAPERPSRLQTQKP